MERIVAGLQQRRVPSARSGFSRTTRPVTRSCPTSSASCSRLRRRRSSRADRRFPRLHAEPACRGSLPPHARGVRRPDDGVPQVGPRSGGGRLRRITNGAAKRPRARDRDRSMVFEFGISPRSPRLERCVPTTTRCPRRRSVSGDSEQARLTDHAYGEAQRLVLEASRDARSRRRGAAREGDPRSLRARGAGRGRQAGVALLGDDRHRSRPADA